MSYPFSFQHARTSYFPFRNLHLSRFQPHNEAETLHDPFSQHNTHQLPEIFPSRMDSDLQTPIILIKKRKLPEPDVTMSYSSSRCNSPISSPLQELPSTLPPINLFSLVQQPEQHQRKCYDGENRHLKPTPLIIRPIKPYEVKEGTASVELCDAFGDVLSKEDARLSSAIGLEKPLTEIINEASFKLKLRCKATTPQRFRLRFTIHYQTMSGDQEKETLLSDSFTIQSNTTMMAKQPNVEGILPVSGKSGCEVWIRGSNFNRKGLKMS